MRPLEETLERELSGSIAFNQPVGLHCTFKAGGQARFLAKPRSTQEAIHVLRCLQRHGVPTVPLGGGSNVLFVGEEYDGAVVLTRGVRGLKVLGSTIRMGAGAGLQGAIRLAERHGLAGLEEFAGIPGTIGGAVFGNAGGPPDTPTVGDRVRQVRILDPHGRVRWLSGTELGLRYRASDLGGSLILSVDLQLTRGDPDYLRNRRLQVTRRKAEIQPVNTRSAGCIFRNPPGDSAGRIIDRLGLKGLRRGAASVSSLHGNFIVNEGGASPSEILELMEEIRKRVRCARGLDLLTEVRLIA